MTVKIVGQEIVIVDQRGRRVCRPLLSGFVCPKCGELLKAHFETDRPVDTGGQGRNSYDRREQIRSLVVPGGQALISGTHRQYGGICALEIYWAPSLRHNLDAWLTKHRQGCRLGNYTVAIRQARAGRIPGLVPIPDIVGGDACLLSFDQGAWCPDWDPRWESYDEWDRRATETAKEKLQLLGVTPET
jgi:hypothetical protein